MKRSRAGVSSSESACLCRQSISPTSAKSSSWQMPQAIALLAVSSSACMVITWTCKGTGAGHTVPCRLLAACLQGGQFCVLRLPGLKAEVPRSVPPVSVTGNQPHGAQRAGGADQADTCRCVVGSDRRAGQAGRTVQARKSPLQVMQHGYTPLHVMLQSKRARAYWYLANYTNRSKQESKAQDNVGESRNDRALRLARNHCKSSAPTGLSWQLEVSANLCKLAQTRWH